MDAGHYWHRVLDFEEKNIHIQCGQCNRMKKGNLQNYSLALIRKYGPGILEELNELKKAHYLNPKPDFIKLKVLQEQLKAASPKDSA